MLLKKYSMLFILSLFMVSCGSSSNSKEQSQSTISSDLKSNNNQQAVSTKDNTQKALNIPFFTKENSPLNEISKLEK